MSERNDYIKELSKKYVDEHLEKLQKNAEELEIEKEFLQDLILFTSSKEKKYVSLDEYLNKSKDHAQYVSYLACGITNVMNLFQPNVIVVGGRVAELGGDELLKEFSELVHKEQYARKSVNKTLIALPTAGPDAAVIGAALAGI